MPKARTLADKLLLKPGARLLLRNAPAGAAVEGAEAAGEAGEADAALLFAAAAAEVKKHLPPLLKALPAGARLWIAYPKAGKLGTDLDRDKLWELVEGRGLQGVRLVALDETWSAMMFRRAG